MANQTADKNVEVGSKLIREINNEAYDLRIDSYKGQLECRVSITVHQPENSISPAVLINQLKILDISDTVDLEQLAIFCTEAANDNNPQDFVLARGMEPGEGTDGYFQLAVDTGEKTGALEDDLGRVDFKQIQTFTNIEAGQLIGTIIPPLRGESGKTITGQSIPAPLGKPAKLIAGDGVEISGDGVQALATKAGRITFNKGVLAISEEFVVSGDVDLKVGHINFNGFVEIKGDVLDDFNITSTKGINVTGAVGACIIESDGPVTIGTMAGMGSGIIRCRGDLTARYLNHATVECWGNVHVSSEIRNSTIKATGFISAPKGLITGGQAIALEGIEAKIFGAKSGVKSYLASGIFFPEADRLSFLRTRIKSIAYQLKMITETLPALSKKNLDDLRKPLREAIELRIDILTQRQVGITAEQDAISDELATFSATEHPTSNAKINALSSIKEGVMINLGDTTESIKHEISGPVSIIEDLQQGCIRQLTYSPLKVSAQQLEDEASKDETVE